MSIVLTALLMLYPLLYIGAFHLMRHIDLPFEMSDNTLFTFIAVYLILGFALSLLYSIKPQKKSPARRFGIQNLLVKLFAVPCDISLVVFWVNYLAQQREAAANGMYCDTGVGVILIFILVPYALVRLTMHSATFIVGCRIVTSANSFPVLWKILHGLMHVLPGLDIISAGVLCLQLRKRPVIQQDLPELPVTSD